jgi:hypothetical protein
LWRKSARLAASPTSCKLKLLAESAFDRAFVKLTADREYAGETWQPTVTGLSAKAETASVTIAVKSR